MGWKKIKVTSGRRRLVPSLSIQKYGRIMWNQSAHEALGAPQFVELLIGEEDNRLGMRSVSSNDNSDDFEVKMAKSQISWSINSKSALQEFGLLVERVFRRDTQKDGDVLFIDVSDIAEHQTVEKLQSEGYKSAC